MAFRAAGGIVTSNPEYRAQKIVVEEIADPAKLIKNNNSLKVYICKLKGSIVSEFKEVDVIPSKLLAGETLLHFYIKREECSSWYNGQTNLDTLNHEAVRRFIEVTHEQYKKNIGEHFAKCVPGIFSDEPSYGRVCQKQSNSSYASPWTKKLREVFIERFGYDIIDHLVELFYDVKEIELSKARINYIDCITYLFVDAFARQIGEWCAANNILYTGHLLAEDCLSHQTNASGSVMRFYENMQAPGIDMLTEHRRFYDTAKQVSSVANQFNKKWRLTETYGCTGWDFPFLGHKAIGDWQAALGINMRTQHLAWYTMEGEAKRDYPASIFYQSPWYQEYHKVEDYFGRINLAMTQGVEIRDVLVIQALESVWSTICKDWLEAKRTQDIDTQMINLRDHLLDASIDFDYGDEDIISRHGSVCIENSSPFLKIGQAQYKSVIVPKLLTVRKSTLELLDKFNKAGGQVIFIGSPSNYVDGEKNNLATEIMSRCENIDEPGTKLISALNVVRRISITDKTGDEIEQAIYLLREDEDSAYLFICNTSYPKKDEMSRNEVFSRTRKDIQVKDRKASYPEVKVELKTNKGSSLLEFDLENGKIYKANAKKLTNSWLIFTSLNNISSRLFVATDSNEEYLQRDFFSKLSEVTLPDKAEILLSENNVLPLDRAKYQIDNAMLNNENYILHIDHILRDTLGIARRGGRMVQPWARDEIISGKSIDVTLSYEFFCDTIPDGTLFLGIERPELYEIFVNKNQILTDSECGWWCDKSLRKLPLSPMFLCYGKNEILLKCKYDENHPGLEAIYLLGNFGVFPDGLKLTITESVKCLEIGDWVSQGLPFYSGSVGYVFNVDINLNHDEKAFLKLNEYQGVCAKIFINSKSVGVIAWEPNQIELTPYIKNGSNEIIIEMFSSRRNSHGPLYMDENWPYWTGPETYQQYTAKYSLVPCGLIEAPKVLISKSLKKN